MDVYEQYLPWGELFNVMCVAVASQPASQPAFYSEISGPVGVSGGSKV